MAGLLRSFFDSLCQNIFEINLDALLGTEDFPLTYSEKNSYSSIACAIDRLGLYQISEFSLNCRGKGVVGGSGDEKGVRHIDFLCWEDKLSVAIEVKRIYMNIGKNSQYGLDKYCKEMIEVGLKQIDEAKKAGYPDTQTHQLLLLNTPIFFKKSQQPDKNVIESAAKDFESYLNEFIDKRRNMGILCEVLDLRESIGKEQQEGKYHHYLDSNNEYMPYVIIGGIVLE